MYTYIYLRIEREIYINIYIFMLTHVFRKYQMMISCLSFSQNPMVYMQSPKSRIQKSISSVYIWYITSGTPTSTQIDRHTHLER